LLKPLSKLDSRFTLRPHKKYGTRFNKLLLLIEVVNLYDQISFLNLPMTLPTRKYVFLLLFFDVLHSWTIPSFRIKVDACPGRLNQAQVTLSRLGTFYGQCSEICGINHGFMPIFCRTVSYAYFIKTGYIFYTEFLRLSQILDCNDELLNLLKKKYIYMMIKEDIL
jgi:hypothetical protein